jgi:predicted XRE-type DNA-binding protein
MREYVDEHWNCHDWDINGYPGEFVHGDDIYLGDFYMDERWLPIRGFYNAYWISTHGRIWSNLSNWFVSGYRGNQYGHLGVKLFTYDGRREFRYIHRLVAEAFIPNPEGYSHVLHSDDDPTNNCVWNLFWGTALDNTRDCIDKGRFRYFTEDDREQAMLKRRMPIAAYNIRDGRETEFASQCEASRKLGISQSEISAVLRKERRHINGWIFAKSGDNFDDYSDIDMHHHAKNPSIIAENVITGERRYYRGLTAAAKDLDISISSVSNVLHGKIRAVKNWLFHYADEVRS